MSGLVAGPGARRGHASWRQRHGDVLSRWPVIDERWARRVERRRRAEAGEAPDPLDREGITLLEAINRSMGLPSDHGADEVARRRGGAAP